MKRRNFFEFTIKPIPFAILIYFIGLYDFKHHIFGNRITIGFFFTTVGVWIIIPYLIRFRNIEKENCSNHKLKRKLLGFILIFLPAYTLIYWIVTIYAPFHILP